MKRNITLYIGGSRVDLNSDSLILYNYTAEQLSNPTIVKNEYSQQITIPGTPNNNQLFGEIFKLDRQQLYSINGEVTGAYFNPSVKTPFVVYEDANIVESGYVKLDKIQNTNGIIKYTLSLYGGLGSFFYGLSFDSDGNPLTLASLDFGVDLSFQIDADTVAEAWRTMRGASSTEKWTILNFAPCYNGVPEDFASDKVLIKAEDAGLEVSVVDGDKAYTPASSGNVIAQLSREYTSLEMQDLRSYMQRPILSIRKMIEAICNPANNGGYTVDLDPLFFNDNNPYYNNVWMTLPALTSLNKSNSESGETEEFTINYTGDYRVDSETVFDDIFTEGALGNELTATLESTIKITLPFLSQAPEWFLSTRVVDEATGYATDIQYFIFVQTLAMAGSTIATASPVHMLQSALTTAKYPVWTPEQVASVVDYTPAFPSAGYAESSIGAFIGGDFTCPFTETYADNINGESITSLRQQVFVAVIETVTDENGEEVNVSGSVAPLTVFEYQDSAATGTTADYTTSVTGTVVQTISSEIGSITITPQMLLSSDKSPAKYFIGYCKLFGLTFIADKAEKKVGVLTKNTLYNDTSLIDLTNRIDTGKEITIVPFVFDSKYYNLGYGEVKGQFAEIYNDTYNANYGDKKINTGYDFNSETKELLTDNAYKNVVEVLGKSKAFVNVTTPNGNIVPAAFVDGGKYSLYDSEGGTKELDIPIPNSNSTLVYFNDALPSYDLYSKPQFHEAENKAIDTTDVLLFYQGVADVSVKYPSLRLTDDTGEMYTLNNSESCWIWRSTSGEVTQLPMFGRYMWDNTRQITYSLDFGTPKELDIPEVYHPEGVSIYPRYWQKYIADRYDVNSRVMTAYVDLSGLVVDRNLLRRFFYYGNAIWVLNKINNHSITSYDRTQCEFVKVIDIENYNNGLII